MANPSVKRLCVECKGPIISPKPQLRCKECARLRENKLNLARIARKKLERGEPVVGGPFVCQACGETSPRASRRQSYCAGCKESARAEVQRRCKAEWFQANKARAQTRAQEWRESNREKARKYGRDYITRNYEKVRVRQRELSKTPEGRAYSNRYFKMRKKRFPAVALHSRISCAIYLSLKARKDGRSWEALVGYSRADLMRHLERQFLKGMSWENMGEWHVDHVTPKSSYTFDGPDHPEFRACWSLPNLRPMWAKENISKGAKRTLLL